MIYVMTTFSESFDHVIKLCLLPQPGFSYCVQIPLQRVRHAWMEKSEIVIRTCHFIKKVPSRIIKKWFHVDTNNKNCKCLFLSSEKMTLSDVTLLYKTYLSWLTDLYFVAVKPIIVVKMQKYQVQNLNQMFFPRNMSLKEILNVTLKGDPA